MLHKLAAEHDKALQDDWREFILENSQGQGKEFVVVDETSKNDHSLAQCYGYAMSGEHGDLVDVFVCGDHYYVLAAMMTEVPGSYDSLSFFDFIAEQVVV
ncbi:hypothetical protein L208DRAFT_1304936 [Tricholoma matsutake]|nr:hypothetical protein L208DRAFT_1304936 [Tricholoma matsutake 945]